jgi:hypothetical protein
VSNFSSFKRNSVVVAITDFPQSGPCHILDIILYTFLTAIEVMPYIYCIFIWYRNLKLGESYDLLGQFFVLIQSDLCRMLKVVVILSVAGKVHQQSDCLHDNTNCCTKALNTSGGLSVCGTCGDRLGV